MNSYENSQMSRTLGTIVVLGGMFAIPAIPGTSETVMPKTGPGLYRSYRAASTANTHDQYASILTGEFSVSDSAPDLEKTVSALYAHLLANQEPLGAAFSEAVQASLWDLYEA